MTFSLVLGGAFASSSYRAFLGMRGHSGFGGSWRILTLLLRLLLLLLGFLDGLVFLLCQLIDLVLRLQPPLLLFLELLLLFFELFLDLCLTEEDLLELLILLFRHLILLLLPFLLGSLLCGALLLLNFLL